MIREKEQIKAHNALLADVDAEKRKSRAATVITLERIYQEVRYPDYRERAAATLEKMETAQLTGGFRPKDLIIKHAHGHVDRKYGWYPDLWGEQIALKFPMRKPGYDKQTMMKDHNLCQFGMPYVLHIDTDVNADLWGIKVVSTADVVVKRHNERIDGLSKIRRKELLKMLTGAGVTAALADVVMKALELTQLSGGLEKSILLESSLNRQLAMKIWKVLASVCPRSEIALVKGLGTADGVERLHCPFPIRLGNDGISVYPKGA